MVENDKDKKRDWCGKIMCKMYSLNHDNCNKESGIKESVMAEEIVLAAVAELGRILEIYDIAKKYMRESGNPNQWNGSYPDRETLEMDIAKEREKYFFLVLGGGETAISFRKLNFL